MALREMERWGWGWRRCEKKMLAWGTGKDDKSPRGKENWGIRELVRRGVLLFEANFISTWSAFEFWSELVRCLQPPPFPFSLFGCSLLFSLSFPLLCFSCDTMGLLWNGNKVKEWDSESASKKKWLKLETGWQSVISLVLLWCNLTQGYYLYCVQIVHSTLVPNQLIQTWFVNAKLEQTWQQTPSVC